MQTHVKVLAVLFIVFSALGVLAAFGVMAAFGIAGVATSAAAVENGDAAIALPFIGITGMALVVFILALSLPGLITGFGLLKYKSWARIMAIVLSAINLINIPFGTILGGYGLWVLLNGETERMFNTAGPAGPPARV